MYLSQNSSLNISAEANMKKEQSVVDVMKSISCVMVHFVLVVV